MKTEQWNLNNTYINNEAKTSKEKLENIFSINENKNIANQDAAKACSEFSTF
jgi:hypothetical protein